MTPPDSTPKLPTWVFFVADAVLLAAAWFLADQAAKPLSPGVLFAVVACVIVGAILATIPLLVRYERDKNEALDERQRALEGLAATLANSAEQISAAAGGLHAITELAQKNLRHAEQLPHKLQDKIAEFQAQLANADDNEKEELEKELTALRTSESERLESIADKIAKSAADLGKLEAATQKNLAATQDALAKAQTQLVTALDQKLAAALAKLDAKLAALEAAVSAGTAAATTGLASGSASGIASVVELPPAAAPAAEAADKLDDTAPKRVRKTRRDDPEVATPLEKKFPDEEPPPVLPHEILPVAPGTETPFRGESAIHTIPPPAEAGAAAPAAVATAAPPPVEVKVARKRSEKKNGDTAPAAPANATASEEPTLDLGLPAPPAKSAASTPPRAVSEFTQVSPDEAAPADAVAADGATRLIITAYIGIGNRLFIRGDGPGLSWEKGVPLQFVSIGKWRWETADATAPVKFKLYKNDDLECAGLGTKTVAAGHQQELTAVF